MISAGGISCEHNCLSLETAGAEMSAVASQNTRVKDPVYHVVLSWPAGEVPTDDEAFRCGRRAIQAVGMEGHQYLFAVHRDTAHAHLHIAVNRVHPESLRAVYPDRDFFHLDRTMRELELEHGWRHDNGPFAVFERDGKKVVDWASRDPQTKGKRPTGAADMERHGDVESLFTYVRGEPRKAVAVLLKESNATWQELHEVLRRFGLELKEKGQGFAVFDITGEAGAPIKASDMLEELSKPRLTRKLGRFEAASADELAAAPTSTYDRFRPLKRDAAKREKARQERADARRGLHERYSKYRKEFSYRRMDSTEVKRRYAELRAATKAKRAEVQASVRDPAARKALYSVIAFETLRARERLRHEVAVERNGLKADPSNRRLSYKEWVEIEAALGDAAAISQLRGWAYSDGRRAASLRSSSDAVARGFQGSANVDPLAVDLGAELKFSVRRNGVVVYRDAGGTDLFVDHGARIEVLDASDPYVWEAAQRLARQKFGDQFRSIETTTLPDEMTAGEAVAPAPPPGPPLPAQRRRRRLG